MKIGFKFTENNQKIELKFRGYCGSTSFEDANGERYDFDLNMELPQTFIPIEFKDIWIQKVNTNIRVWSQRLYLE